MSRRLGWSIDQVTDAWLGYARRPAAQVIDDSFWTPDIATDYCSRCGDSIGPGEQTTTGCGSCRGKPPLADQVVRLGAYCDELRAWVIQTKFTGWIHMGQVLGAMLGRALCEQVDADVSQMVLVPGPMPLVRRLYRGVDHARLLASGIRKTTGARIVPLLGRHNGPPQVSLSRAERQRQGGRGLFVRRLYRSAPLAGCDLVLVDDVRTTGATLRAMRRQLKPFGPARVIAAVVAVSDEKARRSRRDGIAATAF